MPFYPGLKRDPPFTPADRDRTAGHLLELRQYIREHVPRRTRSDTLLLATWNIRDFDSNKFKHGPRLPESFYYIAEIISAFDLVAVQEVNRDLRALRQVMEILGPDWDYLVTDTTEGTSGNEERMAFLYDRSKILFRKEVGEIVLPDAGLIEGSRNFARTPFFVSFQAGWFQFKLCTVHIYFGKDTGEQLQRRIEEIDQLARFIAKRAKGEPGTFILLGDFNIVSPEHETMNALVRHGFEVPLALRDKPTNMFRTKHYDQIAFLAKEGQVQFAGDPNSAGALNFYDCLFREEEFDTYYAFRERSGGDKWDQHERENRPHAPEEQRKYYLNKWRTWQMSDHLPMWVELKVNFSDRYLEGLRTRT